MKNIDQEMFTTEEEFIQKQELRLEKVPTLYYNFNAEASDLTIAFLDTYFVEVETEGTHKETADQLELLINDVSSREGTVLTEVEQVTSAVKCMKEVILGTQVNDKKVTVDYILKMLEHVFMAEKVIQDCIAKNSIEIPQEFMTDRLEPSNMFKYNVMNTHEFLDTNFAKRLNYLKKYVDFEVPEETDEFEMNRDFQPESQENFTVPADLKDIYLTGENNVNYSYIFKELTGVCYYALFGAKKNVQLASILNKLSLNRNFRIHFAVYEDYYFRRSKFDKTRLEFKQLSKIMNLIESKNDKNMKNDKPQKYHEVFLNIDYYNLESFHKFILTKNIMDFYIRQLKQPNVNAKKMVILNFFAYINDLLTKGIIEEMFVKSIFEFSENIETLDQTNVPIQHLALAQKIINFPNNRMTFKSKLIIKTLAMFVFRNTPKYAMQNIRLAIDLFKNKAMTKEFIIDILDLLRTNFENNINENNVTSANLNEEFILELMNICFNYQDTPMDHTEIEDRLKMIFEMPTSTPHFVICLNNVEIFVNTLGVLPYNRNFEGTLVVIKKKMSYHIQELLDVMISTPEYASNPRINDRMVLIMKSFYIEVATKIQNSYKINGTLKLLQHMDPSRIENCSDSVARALYCLAYHLLRNCHSLCTNQLYQANYLNEVLDITEYGPDPQFPEIYEIIKFETILKRMATFNALNHNETNIMSSRFANNINFITHLSHTTEIDYSAFLESLQTNFDSLGDHHLNSGLLAAMMETYIYFGASPESIKQLVEKTHSKIIKTRDYYDFTYLESQMFSLYFSLSKIKAMARLIKKMNIPDIEDKLDDIEKMFEDIPDKLEDIREEVKSEKSLNSRMMLIRAFRQRFIEYKTNVLIGGFIMDVQTNFDYLVEFLPFDQKWADQVDTYTQFKQDSLTEFGYQVVVMDQNDLHSRDQQEDMFSQKLNL